LRKILPPSSKVPVWYSKPKSISSQHSARHANIAFDHLIADYEEEIRERHDFDDEKPPVIEPGF